MRRFAPGAVERFLLSLGYTLRRREGGFASILAARGDERWSADGLDAEDALRRLVDRMFPSAAARELLERALRSVPAEAARGGGGEETEGVSQAEETPRTTPRPDPPPAAWRRRLFELQRPALPPQARSLPRPEPPRLRLPDDESNPEGALERHLAELREIEAEIEASVEEFAWLAPERQRWVLLRFVALARAVQDEMRDREEIVERVKDIVQRLAELARIAWPGNVRAMRLDSYPDESRPDLPGALPRMRTWLELAETVESILTERSAAGEEEGVGPEGWADDALLEPQPHDAARRLQRCRKTVEKSTGTLLASPPRGRGKAVGSIGEQQAAVLLETAAELRWLRGCEAIDAVAWLEAMGRLRWHAERLPKKWRVRLQRLLDPATKPSRRWADRFGYDPQKIERRRRRRALRKEWRERREGADADYVAAWLERAIRESDLTNVDLVPMLEGFEEVVLSIDPRRFEDRKVRRRLRDLRKRLSDPNAGAPKRPAPSREDEDDEPEAPHEALRRRVVPHTRGRKALLVLNRSDPNLERRLSELLELVQLDAIEFSNRSLEAKRGSILQWGYDLVLSATGFQSHQVDRVLREACRKREVPYVRIAKGRPLATLRALERDLVRRTEVTDASESAAGDQSA